MKIEIVEFYPTPKQKKPNEFTGTLHVYVIDDDIDIRGIYVKKKKKNKWYFTMPFKKVKEGNEIVQYPILSYTNKEKHLALVKAIVKEGKKYIQENILKEKR